MRKLVSLGVLGLAALGLAGCTTPEVEPLATESEQVIAQASTPSISPSEEPTAIPAQSTEPQETSEPTSESESEQEGLLATADTTATLLTYLIEEEKLAHDVYTYMYDLYGSQVFGNILEAESKHQDQVAGLLETYGGTDPRSTEPGVFSDPELQALYDDLIELGSQSAQDAYQVGVMIEEKDIADITAQLATASEQDVVTVLEKLRSGSENHLRAFNRQL